MNSYERMVYDKYAYKKPYIYLVYEEFERRVNATLDEYDGLKIGECRFDYKSWENRLNITKKKLQTSIKCLSNDAVIKQVLQGKKGQGSSIYILLRFVDNKKDNNMDNKKDNNKVSNSNGLEYIEDNKKDNNIDNKKVNTSIYNNPNIESNNIYSDKKEEVVKDEDKTTKKKDIPKEYIEIFNYWNSLDIIKHSKVTPGIEKAIKKALKEYDIDTIKLGIKNYNKIVEDKSYFYNHKWTLENFLNRSNGMKEFLEDGQQYINYLNSEKISSSNIIRKPIVSDNFD